ncbi:hypothetical protein L6V77_16400 [Myxococcota bacterium]|jgi:hypothetical protein|nr:hypothetical protein [Myxococcota bacterium]
MRLFRPARRAAPNVSHRALAALALTAALGACSGRPEKPLVGRWAVDVEAMVTRETMHDQINGLPVPAQEKRLAAARAEAARITLEIEEGRLVVDTGLDRQEARFTARKDGDAFVLQPEAAEGQTIAPYVFMFQGEKLKMTWGATHLVLVKR